jgi:hypothetical protein
MSSDENTHGNSNGADRQPSNDQGGQSASDDYTSDPAILENFRGGNQSGQEKRG